MRRRLSFGAALAAGGVLAATVALGAQPNAEDPKLSTLTYYGSGYAERPYDYGEAWFDFGVACKHSAQDVRKAIEAVSGKVWQTIASKVQGNTFSETSRRYWGDIGNIQERPSADLRVQPPHTEYVADGDRTVPVQRPGTAKLIDACSGKELPLTSKVGTVYSGAQRIGVRSTDLDWLEALVRTVNQMNQGKEADAVRFSSSGVSYRITRAHTEEDKQKVLSQAEAAATGPSSDYANDAKNLKFADAHYLGRTPAFPPHYAPTVGEPISKGKAPKVTLDLPLIYTIYAEGKDLINKADPETKGIKTDYEIQGQAVTDADYAESDVALTTECHPNREAASQTLAGPAKEILARLHEYHGNKPSTETDKIDDNEAAAPAEYFPYEPVAWDTTDGATVVKTYLNRCSNEFVDAPKSHRVQDLPGYWQMTRVIAVKSSNFAGLQPLVERLQADYAVYSEASQRARVSVSDPQGRVTDATRSKLAIEARSNATSCIVGKGSPVAQDAARHGFLCAYLKDLRVGTLRPLPRRGADLAARAPAMAPQAPGGGANAGGLQVDVVRKPGSERPWHSIRGSFAFQFLVKSQNYLDFIKKNEANGPHHLL